MYDLFPATEQEAVSRASQDLGVGEPGFFSGFLKGTGIYAMRGFAQVARAVDMAGAVGPIVMDKLTGGTARQDQYFAEHDQVFNHAVDYWTPKPGEVGAAGQIVGSLASGLPLVIANPALAVASTELSSAEDLTRQGVDAKVAVGVGALEGASFATALRLPFLGKTLASRVASGAVGMPTIGAVTSALSGGVLKLAGNDEAAKQFDPFDPTQRVMDLLMGAGFGFLAHVDAKAGELRKLELDQQAKDAILTLNGARHLESVALPGKPEVPFELNKGVTAVRTAMNQLLRGEPVNVEQITQGVKTTLDPERVKFQAEASKVAAKTAGEILPEAKAPIEPKPLFAQEPAGAAPKPEPAAGTTPTGGNAENAFAQAEATHPDPIVRTAAAIARDRPDMRVPTGELDANGNAVSMTAREYMAKAAEVAGATKADAGLFRTAISCLLGVI